jgi:hypothetical protein
MFPALHRGVAVPARNDRLGILSPNPCRLSFIVRPECKRLILKAFLEQLARRNVHWP